MFDIAIILINYNSSQHSINCINSIIDKTSKNINYQIIITDNCSDEEDYLKLKSFCDSIHFPNLQLHRSKINTGFGGGNMHGVQYANAQYLAFVNNDSLFKNDCLSILKNALDNNENIGIAGAQSYRENDKQLISIDHFASPIKEIFGRIFLEKINPKKYPKRKKTYTEQIQANTVSGSFIFIRATDFYKIGGFDTNIFLYHEETDLCKRLEKIKKFTYLIPQAEFIHYHGISTPKNILIKTELKISLLYVIRKHYGYFGHKIVMLFLIIKYFFSSIVNPKNWSLFFVILTGAHLSKSLKNKQKIVEIQ